MIIYGVNAVREALQSDSIRVEQIWLAVRKPGFPIPNGIPVNRTDKGDIGKRTGTSAHQGIAAEIGEFPYTDERMPFDIDRPLNLVMLDRVNDPHNLGAAIRVCEGAGVDALIIGEKYGTGVTPAVFKVSAGAAAHLPVMRVESLPHYAGQLSDAGFTLMAVEAVDNAVPVYAAPALLGSRNLLIFGSEGEGMDRKLLDKSHHQIVIPMRGRVTSLNLSTSVAAVLYRLLPDRDGAHEETDD